MLRKMLLTAFAGSLLAVSAIGQQIVVRVAPPRAHYENRGRAPQRGYVYQRGYQRWDGNVHVWTPGVWVSPPRPRQHWVDHRWEHRNNGYVFVEGHWR